MVKQLSVGLWRAALDLNRGVQSRDVCCFKSATEFKGPAANRMGPSPPFSARAVCALAVGGGLFGNAAACRVRTSTQHEQCSRGHTHAETAVTSNRPHLVLKGAVLQEEEVCNVSVSECLCKHMRVDTEILCRLCVHYTIVALPRVHNMLVLKQTHSPLGIVLHQTNGANTGKANPKERHNPHCNSLTTLWI